MATYTNPSSLLTPTDFKLTGAAAGAFDSIKNAYAFSDMDAGIRDQDLGYLATLNKYNNQMADQPLIDLKRENEISAANLNKEDWQSGLNTDFVRSGKNLEVASNKAKTAAEDLNRSISAGDSLVQLKEYMDNIYGENPELGVINNPEHKKNIDEFRNRIKSAGLSLPEGDLSTPQNQAFLDAKTKAFLNSREMLQKRLLMAEQYTGKAAVEQIRTQARSEDTAATNKTRMQIANLRFADDKTAEATLQRLRSKEGPYTPEEVVNLRQLHEKQFDSTAQAKENMTNFFLDPALKKDTEMAKKAGLDYIRSPAQYYEFVRKSYADRLTNELVQVHGVVGGNTPSKYKDLNLNAPEVTAKEPAKAPTPTSRTVSGKIGGGSGELGDYKGVQYRRRPDLEAAGWTIGENANGQIGYLPPNK